MVEVGILCQQWAKHRGVVDIAESRVLHGCDERAYMYA